MGCNDYIRDTYICQKPGCQKKSRCQDMYIGDSEDYGRLCDDHWNEFYQDVIKKRLTGKSTDELLRDFAGMIFMLERRRR